MEYFSTQYLLWAAALGGLSAASLPLGSILGLKTNPGHALISMMAAFGAGALIAALSVELVAPTVFALGESAFSPPHRDPHTEFYALVAGAVLGGVLFVMLDKIVNAHGGFLRDTASTVEYFTDLMHRRKMQRVDELSCFTLLEDMTPEHVNTLVSMLHPVKFRRDEVIARQHDAGTQLIFVSSGKIKSVSNARLIAEFGPGNVVGAMSMIMGTPHHGTLIAADAVKGFTLSRPCLDKLRALSPEFDQAIRLLASERIGFADEQIAARDEKSREWLRQAELALKTGAQIPDALELNAAREEHSGAPLAIWLGILLDGLPESFVIGSGLLVLLQANSQNLATTTFTDIIPYTLIGGLFLSNFPEALASSANMRQQGWKKRRIFLLWFSLMVITAIGSGAGFILADSLTHTWLRFAEGLAVGAMLTMIAAAMIPEAALGGNGNLVGLSTLAGFLAAISFKLLE